MDEVRLVAHHLTIEVLVLRNGFDDLGIELPAGEDSLGERRMPAAQDGAVLGPVAQYKRVVSRACKDEELADAVHETAEKREIAIHLGELARDDIRHGRGPRTALPQRFDMRTNVLHRMRLRHLAQRIGQRGAAQQRKTYAGYRGLEIRHHAPRGIERGGVGHLQHTPDQDRLVIDHRHDLRNTHVRIAEQRERQPVPDGEARVRLDAVRADADDVRPGGGELLVAVGERARLGGTAGRVVLRVEVDDQLCGLFWPFIPLGAVLFALFPGLLRWQLVSKIDPARGMGIVSNLERSAIRAMRLELMQKRREREHVGERHGPAHFAVEVLVGADRVDDFLGHLPVLQQRLGHIGVPVAHDGLIGELVGEQRRMIARASEYVDAADVVHEAGQSRGVALG